MVSALAIVFSFYFEVGNEDIRMLKMAVNIKQ